MYIYVVFSIAAQTPATQRATNENPRARHKVFALVRPPTSLTAFSNAVTAVYPAVYKETFDLVLVPPPRESGGGSGLPLSTGSRRVFADYSPDRGSNLSFNFDFGPRSRV